MVDTPCMAAAVEVIVYTHHSYSILISHNPYLQPGNPKGSEN